MESTTPVRTQTYALTQTPCATNQALSVFSNNDEEEITFNCATVQNDRQVMNPEINCLLVKETDSRMMTHEKHASQHGFTKIVLASTDYDVMVLGLFHWPSLHQLGVR